MKREIVRKFLIVIIISLFFLSAILILDNGITITGNVILNGNLTNGVHNNTEWNGSAIILSGNNLTGDYVSEILDAGSNSTWNNLTFIGSEPDVEFFFAVDGGGDIYSSSNHGITWTSVLDNYGRTSDTQYMFSDNNSIYIISNSNKEVWKSDDLGASFTVINDTFANSPLLVADVDSSNNLFVVDGSGDVYLSSDSGTSWNLQGDFNSGNSNNAKGIGINSSDAIFIVDSSGSVYMSTDLGLNWTQQTSNYGGGSGTDDLIISGSSLYILFNKNVYNSSDYGITWNIVNNTFTPYSNDGIRMTADSNSNLYIADASGRVFNSSNFGITWQESGDFNSGASSNPKGLTFFPQPTNLNFEVKNCSLPNCSDGSWQTVSLDNINLVGRYFQYKVSFSSPNSNFTPSLNNVSVDYDVLNSAPILSIISPQDSATYGYNESLALNFTVTDPDSNLDSCWYNIDSGTNISVNSCLNTTFSVNGNGNYNLILYANDTLGKTTSDSVDFSVQVGAPTIILNSPINAYLNSPSVIFNYTPTDIDLEACELWGNFSGVFEKNQTDLSPTNGVNNNFNLNLTDNEYYWNIKCNDTIGNSAFNGNKTFYVDTIAPIANITQPVGEKTSRDLDLIFSTQDINLDSCWYNVYRGESIEITNTSINCSQSHSFSVTVDADFIINLYVNDSAGNTKTDNSSFSVDTSSQPPPVNDDDGSSSGGGGGGGGGVIIKQNNINLEIEELKGILFPGIEKSLILSVKNNGIKAINKCKLKSDSEIESNNIENIASGEIVEFPFILKVTDANPKLWIECLEGSKNVSTNFVLFIPDLNVNIESIELGEGEIIINYLVNSESDFNGSLTFRVSDSDGNIISSVDEIINIISGNTLNGTVIISLTSDFNGLLNIGILKNDNVLIEDTIIYGDTVIGTGFAITNLLSNQNLTYGGLLIFFFVIVGFFIIKRIAGNIIKGSKQVKQSYWNGGQLKK